MSDTKQEPDDHWCKNVVASVQNSTTSTSSSIYPPPPPIPPSFPNFTSNILSSSSAPPPPPAPPQIAHLAYIAQQKQQQEYAAAQLKQQELYTQYYQNYYYQQQMQQQQQAYYAGQYNMNYPYPYNTTISGDTTLGVSAVSAVAAVTANINNSATNMYTPTNTPAPSTHSMNYTNEPSNNTTNTITTTTANAAVAPTPANPSVTVVNYAAALMKKPNPLRFQPATIVAAAGPTTTTTTTTTTTSTTATPAGKPSSSDPNSWPPSLKAYVVRAFNICENDDDRKFMQGQLKITMAKIAGDGRLAKHKWELEPIPLLPRLYITTESKQNDDDNSSNNNSSSNSNNNSTNDPNKKTKKKSRFAKAENEEFNKNNIPSSRPNLSYDHVKSLSIYGPGSSSLSSEPTTVDKSAVKKSPKASSKKGSINIMEEQQLHMQQKRADRFKVPEPRSDYEKPKKRPRIIAAHPASSSYSSSDSAAGGGGGLSDADLENLKVIGTCEKLEKDYFRLTSAPDPSTVRPIEILTIHLKNLKTKWKSDEKAEYVYICSQLKAIRQDITVQHITNEFTVDVYETHARFALESGDMNEYNQCQTQLKHFYALGLKGSENEFLAYRILYYVYLQGNKKYQGGSGDLADIMKTLPEKFSSDFAVSHALKIRKAIQLENYYRFFKLYHIIPDLGQCILEPMLTTWRFRLLQRLVKACKPTVSVDFVTHCLGFLNIPDGVDFLQKAGAVLVQANNSSEKSGFEIDTKNSVNLDPTLGQQDSLLL